MGARAPHRVPAHFSGVCGHGWVTHGGMGEAEPRWMTYRELGDALGISVRAAEARAKRHVRSGRWRRRTDNEPPRAIQVLVPPADLEAMRGTVGNTRPRTVGDTDGDTVSHNINSLLGELKAAHDQVAGELRQRLEAAEAHARHLAGEVAAQRERAGRAEGEAQALRSELAAVRGEATTLRGELGAERERGNAALEQAAAAQARLEAGSPAMRAGKALRAILERWKRP